MHTSLTVEQVKSRILVIRGIDVILDYDVAYYYQLPVKRLNEQVSRYDWLFPPEFFFQLSQSENETSLSYLQDKKLSHGEHRKYSPYVFSYPGICTLHGLLSSKKVNQINIVIIQAFAQILLDRTASYDSISTAKLSALNSELSNICLEIEEKSNALRSKINLHESTIRNSNNNGIVRPQLFSVTSDDFATLDFHSSNQEPFLLEDKAEETSQHNYREHDLDALVSQIQRNVSTYFKISVSVLLGPFELRSSHWPDKLPCIS